MGQWPDHFCNSTSTIKKSTAPYRNRAFNFINSAERERFFHALRGNPSIPVGGILKLHHNSHGYRPQTKKAPPLTVLLISSIVRRERDSKKAPPLVGTLLISSIVRERGILPWESLRGNPSIPVGGILKLHQNSHGYRPQTKKHCPFSRAFNFINSPEREGFFHGNPCGGTRRYLLEVYLNSTKIPMATGHKQKKHRPLSKPCF